MSNLQIGASLFLMMLALMCLRVPISASMFIPGAIGYWLIAGHLSLLNYLKGLAFARFSVYDLSVIPLFILMGQFATQGGLSKALFKFANALVGHFRGGMAMASIYACAAFGSVCGSSVATAATLSNVALPEMRRHNYSGRLATASLAVGGTLGILIPPSVPLVVYAILTEQNIAKLFLAAIIPGILATIGYCAVIWLTVKLRPDLAPTQIRQSQREQLNAVKEIWPIALIFIAVFGGIYSGIFTPTEGASVGALGTFLAAIYRRELDIQSFKLSILGTAQTSGMIFLIFIGADMLNAALALSQMPTHLSEWVTSLEWSPLLIVGCIIALYIVLGFFMDELSAVILTIPVIFPAVMSLDLWGLDYSDKAIWFGILVLIVMQMGLVTPPVGLNMYIINNLAKDVPILETFKGVIPFLVSDLMRIVLLFIFPSITLWLVHAVGT